MHTDPELLALLALGEPTGTEEDRGHLASCTGCAAELADLQQVVALGRTVDVDSALSTPSPELWARIRAELALDPTLEPPVAAGDAVDPAAVGVRAAHRHEVAAHALLRPVAASWSDASGSAELATDHRGRRLLQVALHARLPADGVRQAWLVHRRDPRLRQTLGILDGSAGVWTVERSIDLEEYAILEISQQALGDNAYSGDSIVRGELVLVG